MKYFSVGGEIRKILTGKITSKYEKQIKENAEKIKQG